MARSWLLGATTAIEASRVWSYMIRLREYGVAPLISSRIATRTRQRYFKTARSWLRAASVVVRRPKVASLLTVWSCTTQPLGPGVTPAISSQGALNTPRRYCPTARSSSLAASATLVWARLPIARSYTILTLEDGAARAISTADGLFTPPPC